MPNQAKRNIIHFFITYILSAFGYEFIFFIMTLHIYDITKSALDVSIFTVLTFIPRFFSPVCGAIADRFKRQRVLCAASLATAAMLLILSTIRDISGVYVLWFLISAALTFIINVRGTLIAEVMPADEYHKGNSVILTSSNAAKLLAPFLGGLVTLSFRIEALLYATCAIYLAAAAMSCFIRPGGVMAAKEKGRPVKSIMEGLKVIKADIHLKYLVCIGFAWRLFLGLQVSLFVIYIKKFLNGDDSQYGFFMALIALGSIAGSFIGPWLAKKIRRKQVIFWGLAIHYGAFAALGLIKCYFVACGVALVCFAAFYATLVSMHALRDQSTQSSVRGRVYGFVTGLLSVPGILSMVAGGYLAEILGVGPVLLFAGFLAAVSLLLITFFASPFRRDKDNRISGANKPV